MRKSKKKQVILSLLVVCLLFLGLFIFAFFFYRNKDKVNPNDLVIKFDTSDVIALDNVLPLADALGKKLDGTEVGEGAQGYVAFSLKNKSSSEIQYEIYLTPQNVDDKVINDNYVKLYLTDSSNYPMKGFEMNMIPSFADLAVLEDKPESRLLYSGSIAGNDNHKLRLRVWLSDNYSLSDDKESFKFDVNIRSK